MRYGIPVLAAFVGALFACDEPENACDDYVDYMCDCHADDPEFDCETLTATYANAGPDVQDQCVIDLEDQQEADEAAGLTCPVPG